MKLGRWWTVILAFGTAVIGFLVWLSKSADALDIGDKLASVSGALLALAGLFVGLVGLRANAARAVIRDAGQALEDLARLVSRQWEREANARGLTQQAPLDVRWASTQRPVAPSAAEIVGVEAMAARPTRLKLRGGVEDLADALQMLPSHQLVLLGEPGSGKTSAAALLTLQLLAQRHVGDPVPVLLSLASWDPKSQDIETWMMQRISVDHPVFRKRGVHGPEVAWDLIERRMILPVLDALDEVASKADAVRGIAHVVGRNRPMVLTCRADDYEEIIRETGILVGRAAVVELKPVDAVEAARYLRDGPQDADQRWKSVVTALRGDPEGLLARALSTPLAVYLAKTAYASPSTDPADLLALPTLTAVEHHLLDAYLPALYSLPDALNARKWLAFLARRLAMNPSAGNLAWWRLFLLLPRPYVITSATRAALVGALFALGVTILAIAKGRLGPPEDVRAFAIWCLFLLIIHLVGAVIVASVGALVGLAVTLVASWRPEVEKFIVLVPLPKTMVLTLRGTVRIILRQATLGVLMMLVMGALLMHDVRLKNLLAVGLLMGLGASIPALAETISLDIPVDARSALSDDRKATLIYGPSLAAVLSLAMVLLLAGTSKPLSAGSAAIVVIIVSSFVVWWQVPGAWFRFATARLCFALFRKLPWHLVRFLEDAHHRGVLRQVGAVYEFRHQRLQQYFSQQGSE
ncbi:hypothetical protein ACFWN2_04510 [Lentzea sp. NPDC058436]|uniref:hypothetical protein n=1 Tax=Lentzea sp. NPDC058436 TaxID=3346499 RepID=UPI00366A27C9